MLQVVKLSWKMGFSSIVHEISRSKMNTWRLLCHCAYGLKLLISTVTYWCWWVSNWYIHRQHGSYSPCYHPGSQRSCKVVVTASRAAVRARAGQVVQLRKTGSTLPARALICRPFLRQTGGSRSTGTTVLTVTTERQEQTGPVWQGLAKSIPSPGTVAGQLQTHTGVSLALWWR